MNLYKDTGEVGRFLVHLFLLEAVGHAAVRAFIWLFRLFGMPQPYHFWHTTPNVSHWLSTLLLLLAVIVSIRHILAHRNDPR